MVNDYINIDRSAPAVNAHGCNRLHKQLMGLPARIYLRSETQSAETGMAENPTSPARAHGKNAYNPWVRVPLSYEIRCGAVGPWNPGR